MVRTLTVRVPGRPPGANDLIRMGHWRIGKIRATWKAVTFLAAMAAGVPSRPFTQASVAVHWRCRLNRKRDFDNLVSGIKPLLDGLVSSGVMADDSTDVLVRLGPLTVEVGAEVDETVLTVTEETGWQT